MERLYATYNYAKYEDLDFSNVLQKLFIIMVLILQYINFARFIFIFFSVFIFVIFFKESHTLKKIYIKVSHRFFVFSIVYLFNLFCIKIT